MAEGRSENAVYGASDAIGRVILPVARPGRGPGKGQSPVLLAGRGVRPHAAGMFVISEAEAAAIRNAFDRCGQLSAAVEVRRLFPGITDNVQARECARIIAGWKPIRRMQRGRGRAPST
jgi:hypothetical protein